MPTMTITFHKVGGRTPSAWWEAVRETRGRVRGGHMPIGRGVVPHDMGHLATEATLRIDDGFWGLLAQGATFARGTDQRPTAPGRALVAEHRAELEHAEQVGNHHLFAWIGGQATEVGPTFDSLAARWREVPDGGTMTLRWPTLEVLEGPDLPARAAT